MIKIIIEKKNDKNNYRVVSLLCTLARDNFSGWAACVWCADRNVQLQASFGTEQLKLMIQYLYLAYTHSVILVIQAI